MSRCFNESAIAAVRSTSGTNVSVSPGSVIGPDNHLAAVAVVGRVSLYCGIRPVVSGGGVLYVGIFALVITTDQDCAAAVAA